MNASVALFRFRGSGIPETWKCGIIRLENIRLCRFRSAGQVHWPISNQEYKHAENTRVEPKRDGCGTAEGLRRDRGNDGAGRQRTMGRLCVFTGPLAGSQRIERASSLLFVDTGAGSDRVVDDGATLERRRPLERASGDWAGPRRWPRRDLGNYWPG